MDHACRKYASSCLVSLDCNARLVHASESGYAHRCVYTLSPLLVVNNLIVSICYPLAPHYQHTKMFAIPLAAQLRSHSPGLLALLFALSVCAVLNLGTLIFCLRILTRGIQEYSVPYLVLLFLTPMANAR